MRLRCVISRQSYTPDACTEMLYLYDCADMESNPWMKVCSLHYDIDHAWTYACSACMYVYMFVCMYAPMYVCRCVCMPGASWLWALLDLSRSFGFSLRRTGLLGLVGRQPARQSAPLVAQLASYICNWEVVTRMMLAFSFLHRSTQ